MMWEPFHDTRPSVAGLSVIGVSIVDSFIDFDAVECYNVAHFVDLEDGGRFP